MKFSDIFAPSYKIRIKALRDQEILPVGDVLSLKTTPRRGEFELMTKDILTKITPVSSAEITLLSNILSVGQTTIAQLSAPAPDGSVELNILVFFGEQLEMGELEIGLDETAVERTRSRSLADAIQFLSEQCILEHGGKTYFLVVAGASSKIYLESGMKDEFPRKGNAGGTEDKGDTSKNDSGDDSGDDSGYFAEPSTSRDDKNESEDRKFAILGAEYQFALTEKAKGNGTTIFLARKITRVRNRREDSSLRLACGNLIFKDWTAAGELGSLAMSQLIKLEQEGSGYLKKWDEFGNIEGEIFLDRARKLGAISFSIKEENKDGTITLQSNSDFTEDQRSILPEMEELEVVNDDELPDFLNNPSISFANFSDGIADQADAETILGKKDQGKSVRGTSLKVKSVNLGRGELRVTVQNGDSILGTKIIAPVAGEIAQIKRRIKARNSILTNRAVNPNLGLLIEENGSPLPSLPPPKMKPLTAFVKQKVFRNDPTDKQVDAISVALNTPDIALIQGPPGTGKTTVIAAIIERLNEEADKREGIQGRVLLTGFQHDAVENIIQRLTINGLPVPKFGQRSGEKANADFTFYQYRLREWCLSHAADLREKNPQITESLQEKGLRGRSVQYVTTPSLSLAISLLEEALALSDRILGVDLRNRLQAELKRLRTEQDTSLTDNPALSIVRNLRVTEAGFSDDGPDRASELLFTLKNELEENDQEILSRAGKWFNKQEKPPFLKELQNLKRKLLRRYTPAPIFRVEKARDSIINLIEETVNRIRLNGSSVHDKESAALAELLISMENDLQGIMTAVNDYSFAFAATCQQSVNQSMQRMKGIAPDAPGQDMEYDYVIVDEAARVSPRDLMIPMVQGKRIILVGDHRQLPQLIDEEVARQMENGTENGGNNDWLKKSMFEYLFTERIPALEKMDGIKRRVTLDRQYRTHPILGDFISRNFYERFNSEEKFSSGRPSEDFAHTLPGVEGECAVWMDIPLSEGDMKRSGCSITRPSEARAICNKLREWIEYDCKNEPDSKKRLSFGVISFYKAQTELLEQMLRKDLGGLVDSYLNEFRLRIGTVDSFQGMEFDVVFLSLVRTSKSGFGFLQLYNRLNVSMSRQKKLLVAVGDAAFYDTDQAREQVPGLADFLKVCRNQGRVL